MKTLADAWNWYRATKDSLHRMQRLGEKHWGHPSLANTSILQDEHFKMLEASTIVTETDASLKPIDDLAVVVPFSVFESQVRDYLLSLLKPQAASIVDPILKKSGPGCFAGSRGRELLPSGAGTSQEASARFCRSRHASEPDT